MKINKPSSKTINFIFGAGMLLFLILWLTVPKEKELIFDEVREAELLSQIDSAKQQYFLTKEYLATREEMIVALEKKQEVLIKEIKAKKIYNTIEENKVVRHTLQEDSAYFADHSGEPVKILSDVEVVITPMQLKYANVQIVTAKTQKELVVILEENISNLSSQNSTKDEVIEKQAQQIELDHNAIQSSQTLLEQEKEKLAIQKKIDRKKKLRTGLISGAIGLILGLTVMGVAG